MKNVLEQNLEDSITWLERHSKSYFAPTGIDKMIEHRKEMKESLECDEALNRMLRKECSMFNSPHLSRIRKLLCLAYPVQVPGEADKFKNVR